MKCLWSVCIWLTVLCCGQHAWGQPKPAQIIKGTWQNTDRNQRLVITDSTWAEYEDSEPISPTGSYKITANGDTIKIDAGYRYQLLVATPDDLLLRGESTSEDGWDEANLAHYTRDTMPATLPAHTNSPDTGEIWRDKKLMDILPVAYYYNLLAQDSARQLPMLAYVPAWKELVVASDEFGHKFDIDLSKDYDRFLYSQGNIQAHESYNELQIGEYSPGAHDVYYRISAKLLYTAVGPLLCIRQRSYSKNYYMDMEWSSYFRFSGDSATNVTRELVPEIPAKDFFSKPLPVGFEKHCQMETCVEFNNSDVLEVWGRDMYDYCGLRDDNGTPRQKRDAEHTRICKIFAFAKPTLSYYKLDHKTGRFVKLVQWVPRKTAQLHHN